MDEQLSLYPLYSPNQFNFLSYHFWSVLNISKQYAHAFTS